MIQKFRKKPVVIETIQWTGTEKSSHEVIKFCEQAFWSIPSNVITIDTLEGTMQANIGDWIIKDVAGEFYPCKPDIFEKTYEKI